MNPNPALVAPTTTVINEQIATTCKFCHFQVLPTYYFCPNCGKKIKEPPLSTSIGKQIYVYALSVALPPLGLWPGLKYLLDKRPSAKIIGIIAIVLTILSTVITIKLTMNLLNGQKSVADQQLQQLENSGY